MDGLKFIDSACSETDAFDSVYSQSAGQYPCEAITSFWSLSINRIVYGKYVILSHSLIRKFMAHAPQPVRPPDQVPLATAPQTLSSESVLDALKMILIGAPLNEVLTSVTRLNYVKPLARRNTMTETEKKEIAETFIAVLRNRDAEALKSQAIGRCAHAIGTITMTEEHTG